MIVADKIRDPRSSEDDDGHSSRRRDFEAAVTMKEDVATPRARSIMIEREGDRRYNKEARRQGTFVKNQAPKTKPQVRLEFPNNTSWLTSSPRIRKRM
jgi:hypothetical protein